jgi:hypothetical protein
MANIHIYIKRHNGCQSHKLLELQWSFTHQLLELQWSLTTTIYSTTSTTTIHAHQLLQSRLQTRTKGLLRLKK